MPRTSPAEKLDLITRLTRSWKTLTPGKRYYGMTLAQFASATRECYESRAEIKRLQADLRSAIARRNSADAKAMALRQRMVLGIVGDAEVGENSALYEALGYVPRRARRTGRYRRKPKSTRR